MYFWNSIAFCLFETARYYVLIYFILWITASTSTQVAVLPWYYDAEMGTTNSLHALA